MALVNLQDILWIHVYGFIFFFNNTGIQLLKPGYWEIKTADQGQYCSLIINRCLYRLQQKNVVLLHLFTRYKSKLVLKILHNCNFLLTEDEPKREIQATTEPSIGEGDLPPQVAAS
jgi:hypothetical protein